MYTKTEQIRIYPSDKKLLKGDVKTAILKAHPELKGISMSYAFLINKVVEYALE